MLVTAPYWRSDIHLAEDLVEEVARIIGYEKIPLTTLRQEMPRQNPEMLLKLKRRVRDILVGFGFQEVVTYSLTNNDVLGKLTPEPHPIEPSPIRLINPMTEEQGVLRTTLRAGLLATLVANRRFEEGGIRLFEVGRVYLAKPTDLPDEPEMLTGILAGDRLGKSWDTGNELVDLYDAKGVAEGLLSGLGAVASFLESNDESLAPGKRADILINGSKVGVLGEVHPKVLANFEITEPAYIFELALSALLSLASAQSVFKPLPRFPSVPRDIALVLDANIAHERVLDIITSFPLVTEVSLFDVYSGKQVPAGKKSLAYHIIFQSPDHTLTDEEADNILERITARLSKELKATLRA